ncbi:MAG: hypothetical protein GX605_10990 [Chloroflexi bacterium]|nr:hypothetical protein [Chloroflexota bacterium]
MNRHLLIAILSLLLLKLVLSACSAPANPGLIADDPMAAPTSPVASPTPATPEAPPEAVTAALRILGQQFRADADLVRLLDWEPVTWSDGCLGVPLPSACTEALVPGYRMEVEIQGDRYEYRSSMPDAQPYLLLLAAGPDPGIERPLLTWEADEAEGCRSLVLGLDGRAAVGPCGAPQTPLRLRDEVGRSQQWRDLVARFAPFEAETPSGRVAFRGQGPEAPSAGWQRAIGFWARLVQLELRSGRSGASWGTVLAWQEEMADRPGYCRFLQVEGYGTAFASVAQCGGGDPQTLGQDWLRTPEWERMDGWLASRASVDLDDLRFMNASGAEAMSEEELEQLRAWAAQVYDRLAGPADVRQPSTSLADVEQVDVLLLESFPVQARVVARGNLRDGCTVVDRVTQERRGQEFWVTLTTARRTQDPCIQVLVPFEESTPLEVAGLPAGVYAVHVNGVRQTFTLAVDNVLR